MRKLFLFLCAALFASQAWAQTSFTVGNFVYTITDASNRYVSVRCSSSNVASELVLSSQVTNAGTTYTVTSIDGYGFSEFRSLTKITIPNTVTSIGDYAFKKCSNLTTVTFASTSKVATIGREAFENCSSLTSIIIPSSVTTIGREAFENCSNLTSVTFASTSKLTAISDYTFGGCSSLTSITIPNSVISIGSGAFNYCNSLTSITIPNTVTSIGSFAFDGCSSLATATFKSTSKVASIGYMAFAGCCSLTTLAVPNSVTTIEMSAFENVKNVTYSGSAEGSPWGALTVNGYVSNGFVYTNSSQTYVTAYIGTGQSVTIPGTVTTIGNRAFYGCTTPTTVSIPSSVTNISITAFSGCNSLTAINVNTGNSVYASDGGMLLNKNKTTLITCPCGKTGSYTIPNTVTSVGIYAFSGCKNLTSITIPNSVTSIGYSAFSSCNSLTSITIPNSVTSIDDKAFEGCKNLASVNFASTSKVESIGKNAFYGCEKLSSITIPKSVTNIGEAAFSGCSGLTSVSFDGNSNIETIEYDTFINCKNLSSITIPNSVTSIGQWAFGNCYSLSSLTIPSSVTIIRPSAFDNCRALSSVTFASNSSVETIGESAFNNCDNLSSITIPNSVTVIGSYAFRYCENLSSVIFAGTSKVESIGTGAFKYCTNLTSITIPNSVTTIGGEAFNECTGLTSVTIPNKVTSIGSDAFRNVNNIVNLSSYTAGEPWGAKTCIGKDDFKLSTDGKTLEKYNGGGGKVYLPDNITTIGSEAFKNCYNITSLYIPNSVTTIGDYAFYNCSDFSTLTIPSSVTTVGDYLCAGSNISSIYVEDGNTALSVDDNGVLFNKDKTTLICCPPGKTGSYTIPNTVTSIGNSAFSGCNRLTSITIPNSVTSIGEDAFQGCNSLQYYEYGNAYYLGNNENNHICLVKAKTTEIASCTISESCKFIYRDAFSGCNNLTSITIPSSVATIGNNAFAGCGGLKTLNYNTNAVGSIFNGNTSLETVVIGASVTSIGNFGNCLGLQSVTILSNADVSNANLYFTAENIRYHVLSKNTAEVAAKSYSGSVVIPESVTAGGTYTIVGIANGAFTSCKLTDIDIPSSVKNIDADAFPKISNYISLQYLTYNTDAVGSIFKSYTSLKYVVIGSSVTEVGDFSGCTGLEYVVIRNDADVTNSNLYFTAGDIRYHVLSKNTVEVAAKSYSGSVVIPETVTAGETYAVVGIAGSAFADCTELESVTIPSSVATIGNNAFAGCSGLKTLNYNTNAVGSIFNGNTSLETVVIGASVTSIGNFGDCSRLESVTILSNADVSNANLYFTAENIRYHVLSKNTAEVAAKSYSGSVVIPESVTAGGTYTIVGIAGSAFTNCSSLISVTIPYSVASIGDGAFSGCSGLKALTFNTNAIGTAFAGNESLTTINIGDNVTSIPDGAFRNLGALSTVVFGNFVENIGNHAFCNCGFTRISIPNTVTNIGDSAFASCKKLKSVDIPEAATNIGAYAFSGCTAMTAATISESVETLGKGAFSYCQQLKSIEIPESVTTIDDTAFYHCDNLASVTIAESVETIGKGAFAECKSVKYLTYNTNAIGTAFAGKTSLEDVVIGESVSTFDIKSFEGCTNLASISVDRKNVDFSAEDGVLFNKNKTTLLYCPAGAKEGFYIPISVTCVANNALKDIGMEYNTSNGAVYLGDFKNPYRWLVSVESASIASCTVNSQCEYIIGNAFNGCSNLAYVNVPESVAEVGDKAFNGCNATLYCAAASRPDGWSTKASITKVVWGVILSQSGFVYSPKDGQIHSYIGDNKTIVSVPQNIDGFTITSIGEKAFCNCPDLQSVTIPATIKSIDKTAFNGCNSIKTLAYYTDSIGTCFAGNKSLETVIVGSDVTKIADGAFEGCSKLWTVTIGALVKTIGNRAFANCHELRELTFGGSVLTTIGKEAFTGCHKIKTIKVPSSVTSIGENAFMYVKNVEYGGGAEGEPWNALTVNGYIEGDFVYLDETKEKITAYIGDGYEVEIPQYVENIGKMAFFDSDSLRKVTIPDNSVMIINTDAFAYCSNLETINIPLSVTIISRSAFRESNKVTIYCATSEKLKLWDEDWTYGINAEKQVVWGEKKDDDTAVSDNAASAVSIYAYGNQIVVENATGEICVYNAMGALVCRDANRSVRAEITVNTQGVYIVKTSGAVKRVVVN
jgi:hypothetical protein